MISLECLQLQPIEVKYEVFDIPLIDCSSWKRLQKIKKMTQFYNQLSVFICYHECNINRHLTLAKRLILTIYTDVHPYKQKIASGISFYPCVDWHWDGLFDRNKMSFNTNDFTAVLLVYIIYDVSVFQTAWWSNFQEFHDKSFTANLKILIS